MTADNLAAATWPRVVFVFSLLLCAPAAGAQLPPSAADNAALIQKGEVRLSLTTVWQRYDERSGFTPATDSRSEALGALYSNPAVGVQLFPRLSLLQSSIASLSGIPQYQLSLGASSLRAEVLKTITPVSAEFGLTRKISLFASVPIMGANGETVLTFNPAQNEGNVGINPSSSIAAARTANTSVSSQLTTASNSLEQLLATCSTAPQTAGCSAVLPRLVEAQTLISESRQFRDVMESSFGVDTVAGAKFVPVTGSAAHSAINARLTDFNTLYRQLLSLDGAAPDPLGARPFAAQTGLTGAQFRSYLEDAESGIALAPLLSFRRQGIGDIEIGARLQLLNTFSQTDSTANGIRVAVSLLGRLPTGVIASANVPFDVGTGDGQPDMEVGGATDIQFSKAFGVSASGRFGSQFGDDVELRVAPPGTPFPDASTLRTVQRDLGDYITLSIRPRMNLGPYFALTGAYDLYSKGEDSYADSGPVPANQPGASVLNAGTAVSISRVGAGVRVANYPNSGTSRQRTPIDFSFMYLEQIGSSGFGVPDAPLLLLQLRVLLRAFARREP